jgi:hypothetical protein
LIIDPVADGSAPVDGTPDPEKGWDLQEFRIKVSTTIQGFFGFAGDQPYSDPNFRTGVFSIWICRD